MVLFRYVLILVFLAGSFSVVAQKKNDNPTKQSSKITEKQQKKLQRLVKKQELTEKEQQLKIRVEGGMNVSRKAQRKYNRIYHRQSKAKQKYDNYLIKIHLSHQSKKTEDMMKATKKKSKARWMRQNGNLLQKWWYRNK